MDDALPHHLTLDGQYILYVGCKACGHEGTVPGDAVKGLWGDALWSRLRCSACGVKGRVGTSMAFATSGDQEPGGGAPFLASF